MATHRPDVSERVGVPTPALSLPAVPEAPPAAPLARDFDDPRSAPRDRVAAPDLIGSDLSTACETAAWAGASLSVITHQRSHGPWYVVVAQSPSPGTTLNDDWQVRAMVHVPAAAPTDGQ